MTSRQCSINCEKRPIDLDFLDVSYDWFQSEEFRRLIMSPVITRVSQLEWFNSLPVRKDYLVWGISCESEWIGACGLKKVDLEKCKGEYWGYIGVPRFRGQGIGKWMLASVETEAISRGVTQLYLKVWKDNLVAISLYERFGYKKTTVSGDVFCMEKFLK